MAGEEHEGASVQEQLVEACRRNNVSLLLEVLGDRPEEEIARLLNNTKTIMGNYLYHEAASRGNYEIIDVLLDQEGFECDPVNRLEGDTPLHTAIRWINAQGQDQWRFGNTLVDMMLEAGSGTRARNKGGLTPAKLVDPRNVDLKALIERHQYKNDMEGDFVDGSGGGSGSSGRGAAGPGPVLSSADEVAALDGKDGFEPDWSGSDEDEREEYERRKAEAEKKKKKKKNGS